MKRKVKVRISASQKKRSEFYVAMSVYEADDVTT